MKTLIAFPVMGQFEVGRTALQSFDYMTSMDSQFLLIDNTPGESPWRRWAEEDVIGKWIYLPNGENIGMIRSIQQAYGYAAENNYEVLALSHNDVWIYEQRWDWDLRDIFHEVDKLGGVSFFGSKGCGREGHRLGTFGSLVNIKGHGRRMTDWFEPAVCFDGFFMAFSMEMLRGVGGFDQTYQWHHIYDLDASLTSIAAGYKNVVLNVPCHHLSGMTANNEAYATSGEDIHKANSKRFFEKWAGKLGVTVDEEFNYQWGL